EDLTLRTAWQKLSPRDREVLRLSAWEGLDGSALATALGISVSGAGAALSRARARFREELAAQM
ncbi:MAG: sigma factor-like helix-turn-helix DNA-binding protein, partial [Candidatus Nanopelagicales bacterium]